MRSICCKMRTNFAILQSKNIRSSTKRIKKILDTKYEKINLKEIINELKQFNSDEQMVMERL